MDDYVKEVLRFLLDDDLFPVDWETEDGESDVDKVQQ